MNKVAEFDKTKWNCRQCGEPTGIVYSIKKGDRILYVCQKCNDEDARSSNPQE